MSSFGYLISNIPPGGGNKKPLSIFLFGEYLKLEYILSSLTPAMLLNFKLNKEITPLQFNIKFSTSPNSIV